MALAAPSASGTPFTPEHFEAWAYELELDNGDPWRVETFFLDFLDDYFAGVPENWLIVPEGNTKTTSVGGLTVYLLEFRHRAQIPWAASSRDQAEIGYRQAEGFVLGSSRLKRMLKCQEGYRRIKRTDNGARLQVFAADASTGDGIIPTDAFIDELHRHQNLGLYRTWSGKLEKRGGQLTTISTAGEPGGQFEETRERIRQETPIVESRPGFVRCRSARMNFHEYALPEGADPEDMAMVKLANPFSGITEETLARKFATPTMSIGHWKRLTCNVATRSEFAAIQEQEWFDAQVDDSIPSGEESWVGADIAWKWDTTALVPFWLRDDKYRLFGDPKILTPPRDGSSLDPEKVEQAFIDLHERNPIHTVVMDTSRAEQLGSWLEREIGCRVVDQPQGIPVQVQEYDAFMEALRNGWLHHTGDAEFTRHVLNAVAKIQRGGDAIFERPHQSRRNVEEQDRRVIDALKAAAMVHLVATLNSGKARKPSRYNNPEAKLVIV